MTGPERVDEMPPNPFVGPRPIEKGQPIFGRDLEIAQLYDLLYAERIVLLYSPSGAGKSSLVQAGLIPRLAQQFDVWKPVRVNLEPETDARGVNRYVRSCIFGFEAGVPKRLQREEKSLSSQTLQDYVAGRPQRPSAPKNIVMIFDQFEEVLTADPFGVEAKKEFFSQLGKLLQDNPSIWALFVIREDYLAPFDPYAEQLPTHLKNRFRLDLLGTKAAQETIDRTVESAGRSFAPQALGRIVADLATMQVQQTGGKFKSEPGRYIEPLQLQVVCRNLWERMAPDRKVIEDEDIDSFGDVTSALAEYYDGEVKRATGAVERVEGTFREWIGGNERMERSIREWVGGMLITRGNTRGQVLLEAGESGGLDNTLVERLIQAHLVRGEQRAGATWFELSHDRLIKPVQENNSTWLELHLSELQKTASVWKEQGKPEGLLFLGKSLKKARAWARKNHPLTTEENEFLAASATRNLRRQTQIAAFCTVAVLGVAAVAMAVWAQLELSKARRATAATYMASAESAIEQHQPAGLALAYFAEAYKYAPDSVKTHAWMTTLLTEKKWWLPKLSFDRAEVSSGDLSRDGRLAAIGLKDGTVQLFDADSGKLLKTLNGNGRLTYLFFDFTGRRLMVVSGHSAQVWDTGTFKPLGKFEHSSDIYFANLSWDGNLAATISNYTAVIWDASTGKQVGATLAHEQLINSLTFSHDEKLVLTASNDGTAKVWNAATGALVASTPKESNWINTASFSWDDRFFVTATSGGANARVEVWATPPRNDANLRLMSTLKHKDDVQNAEFSPTDSNTVVTASYDTTAAIWHWTKCDQRDGANEDACEDLPKLLQHDDALQQAIFSDDGTRIVTQSLDNRVQVWDAATGHPIGGRIPHRGNVNSVGISRDGGRILTSSEGAGAQVWELDDPGIESGKPIEPKGFVALGLVETPDGLRVVGTEGGNFRLLDDTGAYVLTALPVGDSDSQVIANSFGNPGDGCWRVLRYKAIYQPDGKTLAGYNDAQVWDFRTGKPIGPALSGSGLIDLSPDGKRILVSSGNTDSIFDATTGMAQGYFKHDGIVGHSFSPDGSRVISEYSWGAQLWNAVSGKPIGNEIKHGGAVNDAEFSADGKRVATASDDRTSQVWDAFTSEPIGSPLQHAGTVVSAQFSPDPGGKYVMTEVKNGLSQGLMQVWEVKTGRRIGAPIHIANTRAAPYFSPDGNMIVTSNLASAQLWDTKTGKPIGEPIGLGEDVYAASFSTDGREIEVTARTVSGSGYYRMHIFRFAPAPGNTKDSKLLAPLADAVGGYSVDEKTGAADVIGPDKRFATLQQLRQDYKIPDKEGILHFFGEQLTAPLPDKH